MLHRRNLLRSKLIGTRRYRQRWTLIAYKEHIPVLFLYQNLYIFRSCLDFFQFTLQFMKFRMVFVKRSLFRPSVYVFFFFANVPFPPLPSSLGQPFFSHHTRFIICVVLPGYVFKNLINILIFTFFRELSDSEKKFVRLKYKKRIKISSSQLKVNAKNFFLQENFEQFFFFKL